MAEVELVAHRAGNGVDSAVAAEPLVDMIELDLHVFRGRVEVRHEKVLRPTSRLWEKWYLLPKGARGVPVADILSALDPSMPLMLDLKCFTRRAAKLIEQSVPRSHPVIASTRSWWILSEFRSRPMARRLRSCKGRFQLWLALRLKGLGPDDGLSVHVALLDAATVERITDQTSQLFTWDVPSPERGRQLSSAGVRGLIVDDLHLPW